MTDDEIIQLINANTDELWSGAKGIRAEKALAVIRCAIKQQQEINDEQTVTIAQQNAKIYAYEAIIANSNFKAILPKKGEK